MSFSRDDALESLIDAGRRLDQRGWVPATSGNLSVRLDEDRIAITVSGAHKGHLGEKDILLVDAEGRSLDERKPSAETALHCQIYRRNPTAGAVLHPHSPGATLLSKQKAQEVVLEGYELLKALEGITTHDTAVALPIFPNDQDIPRLAALIDDWMNRHGMPKAYLIRQHGFYTWAGGVKEALRQVEALEFLFDLETRLLTTVR